MSKIAFVTDSTAGLTPEQMREYGVTVVPLSVIFGEDVFQEGIDLSSEEFYARLRDAKALPTTSQPPVGEFVKAFEHLLQTHDTVMCLMLSEKVSGTFNSARTAAGMVGGNVYVVDSRIASFGIAGPIMDGARLAAKGASPDDILKLWNYEIDHMQALFIVDTLEYLHKGGRIGGAAAVFGALLQIKPILTLIDGKIELFEKIRTFKRAAERVWSEFDSFVQNHENVTACVVHAARAEDAAAWEAQLKAQYPQVRTAISELGPVVATHTGPGVLALVYYSSGPYTI